MRIKLNNSLFSLCLVLLLVCNSCKSNHQNSNNTVSISKATKSTKKNLNKQVEMFKNILDISLETAENTYGEPINSEEFVVDDALPEFRIELYNYIKKENYENNTILIKERTWNKDQKNNITVWYRSNEGKWMPIHHLIWDKESEF